MAELFLFNITEVVLSKVSSPLIQQINSARNIKSEMSKLKNTLSTLKAVILDADEKQAKNHEVRDWLQKLKDVVYDIDDFMDDLTTKKSTFTMGKVRKFFSKSNLVVHRFKTGHRVKGLRKRLDEIALDRKNFHFTEHENLSPVENKVREQTHSYVRASDIIGRDDDKEFIIQLILSSNNDQRNENVSIIPIVGIGGLGKTTIVKLVYNDSRVIESFDLGIWVSVSEDFSVGKILEKILKSATGESFSHLDMDHMQKHLADVLCGKKYLLVLDDVWNEDRNKWMDLHELLINCESGSKIIVTTRSQKVAKITGTISPCNLNGLSDDDCLSLLLKCAFKGPEDWVPSLVEIGKEIVKKCGGVPLAVKTLGSLLYMNTNEQEWLHIRDNEIWEMDQKKSDILPLLRLSYEQLPSHLRQCFAYCSIFPKGVEIPREAFVNLWMAQGFVPSLNGNRSLEEIGNQFFNELLSRFCFQEVVEAFDGEILACKIHNLVHDLAQSVAFPDCLSFKSDTKYTSDKVRHIHFHGEDRLSQEFSKALLKFKKLRSLRFSFKIQSLNKPFVHSIVKNFVRLRVLILNSLELEELPSSIGKLKKLRYLDLSHGEKIKSLPKSICKLTNLQTLNLIKCDNLGDLPKGFENLSSLKTLYLTCQEPSFFHQKASSLEFLLLYNCDFVKLPSHAFQHYTSLRVLRIYDCPRLISLPKSIKYLTSLEKLWIWNCEELDLFDGEGFEGLENLQSLLLLGLPKLVHLPRGLKETCSKTLKFLRVANCVNLTDLPEWLVNFGLLQKLYIEDCPKLSFVPEEVQICVAKVFISGCPKIGNLMNERFIENVG